LSPVADSRERCEIENALPVPQQGTLERALSLVAGNEIVFPPSRAVRFCLDAERVVVGHRIPVYAVHNCVATSPSPWLSW